jgi:hypothetical protein
MANFNTHLNVAVLVTGVTAATLLVANQIELNTALWLWFLGTVGGLLPDVDSDNSTSLNSIFNLFSLTIIIIAVYYMTGDEFEALSFLKLITIPIIIYIIINYGIRKLFEILTVHRGSCHSLLFLVLCALLTTQVIWLLSDPKSILNSSPSILNYSQKNGADILAWLSGGFVFIGGFIHLLLDEIYSVDLANARIKRSFGTALKLADFKNMPLTVGMSIAVIVLLFQAPPTEKTIDILTDWSLFRLY